MGENELVLQRKNEIVVSQIFSQSGNAHIDYQKIDATHYSFTCKPDDKINLKMDESDNIAARSDFVDAEFINSIDKVEWPYYSAAAASGLLTGALSRIKWSSIDFAKISEWKSKDWDKYTVIIAKLVGYKKNDAKGAVQFIINKGITFDTEELEETAKKVVKTFTKNLSAHPSVCGLIFSIWAQFSEGQYQFDEKGNIELVDLPEHYVIGNDTAEKTLLGILYWIFNVVIDAAISKRQIIEELGIPKDLVKIIKEVAGLELLKNVPENLEQLEESFSNWIGRVFAFKADDSNETFDFTQMIMAGIKETIDQSFSVVMNECIFRGFYMVRRLLEEIRNKNVSSISEFDKIDLESIVPFNNKIISRMSLIASGTFVTVNIAGATLKALANKGDKDKKFAESLMAEINIAGVGRFIFSCAEDSKYWASDIALTFEKLKKKKAKPEIVDDSEDSEFDENVYESMRLDSLQTRILYSLESLAVSHDIAKTEDQEKKELKQQWLDIWQKQLLIGMKIDNPDYFVTDEEMLYAGIYELSKDKDNWKWFYLMTMELALFDPYHPLGIKEDGKFKKLKCKYDYATNQFIRKQTIVSQDEVEAIKKKYDKYNGLVSGSTQGKVISVSVAAIATLATGGVAFAVAPQIAIALAGEAVVGLHGAALTSASLAFVGGGSLAAGGLGMAGGTAIITGGGALIGLASSGTASVATVLLQTPSEYWIKQSAKLLTFSDIILKGRLEDKSSLKAIEHSINSMIDDREFEIQDLEADKNDLEKETIKKMKDYVKYLKRCSSELKKLIEK